MANNSDIIVELVAIGQDINEVSDAINQLTNEVDEHKDFTNKMYKSTENLNQKVNLLSGVVNTDSKNLGILTNRVNNLKNASISTNQNITEVEETIDGHAKLLNQINQNLETIKNKLLSLDAKKVDGFRYENNNLFLTSGGEDVTEGVKIISASGSGGGGGGGSGTQNDAVFVANRIGASSASYSVQEETINLVFNWSSTEEGITTVEPGTVEIWQNTAEPVLLMTQIIEQGLIKINVAQYLSSGINKIYAVIKDQYENSKRFNYTINITDLRLVLDNIKNNALFEEDEPIVIRYRTSGAYDIEKTLHVFIDDVEQPTATNVADNSPFNYTLTPSATCDLSAGEHILKLYCTTSNGNLITATSNVVTYSIVCASEEYLKENPIISSSYTDLDVDQYDSIVIPFKIYNGGTEATVILSDDKGYSSTIKVTNIYEWAYTFQQSGETILKIQCGNSIKVFNFNVDPININFAQETNGLKLYLTSAGRQKGELNAYDWSYTDSDNKTYTCQFENINEERDLWQLDKDGLSVCRLTGDARLIIPYMPFNPINDSNDPAKIGQTIEIEFATSGSIDYDAKVIDCSDGANRGLIIKAQSATYASDKLSASMGYREDQHIRLAFVTEPNANLGINGNAPLINTVTCYVNGIASSVQNYLDDINMKFKISLVGNPSSPYITIGSNDCITDIYAIRIYDHALTRRSLVNNWIYDTANTDQKLGRFIRNNIYKDDKVEIDLDKLTKNIDIPYMVITAKQNDRLPQKKKDVQLLSGYFIDPKNKSRCFKFTNAQFDVQGTSSQFYPRKNFKMKMSYKITENGETKKVNMPFISYYDGESYDTFAVTEGGIGVRTFCFKADVASSEGANNVELIRLYEDMCPYKTKPQETNSKVRQGIDGFPMVMFWKQNGQTTFVGKYNFNNDKSNEEVFGFSDGDESWEVLCNGTSNVEFKDTAYYFADPTNEDITTGDKPETLIEIINPDTQEVLDQPWQDDFEARYPEDNEDLSNLKEMAAWVASTNTEAATNEAFSEPITINNTTYEADTAEYRLAKFKSEFSNIFDKDMMTYYYIFTEVFLMIDSRAKNMFMTKYNGGKWFTLPYDFDTALGINNEGRLVFNYDLEDIDYTGTDPIFNGQHSVLWKNFRACFFNDISTVYGKLRGCTEPSKALTYENIENRFSTHQGKWSETIYNEDAYYKYLEPAFVPKMKPDGTTESTTDLDYLYMLQGSKAEQRKWWLYNRIKYLDSKYFYNDNDSIGCRINGGAVPTSSDENGNTVYDYFSIDITPYADIYGQVILGDTANGTKIKKRLKKGIKEKFVLNATTINDRESSIYSASQLLDLGDLSPIKLSHLNLSKASRLKRLIIGKLNPRVEGETYVPYLNTKLEEILTACTCPLIREFNVAGCIKVNKAINLSKCYDLKTVEATFCTAPSITLPQNGNLETYHFSSQVGTLDLENLPKLKDLSCDLGGFNYTYQSGESTQTITIEPNKLPNLTKIVLKNCCGSVSKAEKTTIYNYIKDLILSEYLPTTFSTLDLEGFNYLFEPGETDKFENVATFLNKIKDLPEVTLNGTFKINTDLTYEEIKNFKAQYNTLLNNVLIDCNNIMVKVSFYKESEAVVGAQPHFTELILINTAIPSNTIASITTPTKAADMACTYTFNKWNYNNEILTKDTSIYAIYTPTYINYTIRFLNDDNTEVLGTTTLHYGQIVADEGGYEGETPVRTTEGNYYSFDGWLPLLTTPIEGNTDFIAQYKKNPQLEKPTNLSLYDSILSWDIVPNAISYDVYSENNLIANVTTNVIDLSNYITEDRTYTITVKANADIYPTSEVSDSISYVILPPPYLRFNAEDEKAFTLKTNNTSKNWDGTIEYSTDKISWNTWDGSLINSSNNGKLYLRGTNNTTIVNATDYSTAQNRRFVLAGDSERIQCKGNIENLLDYQTVANGEHPTMASYCFCCLFYECSKLVKAPELFATTLADNCYRLMFSDCTSLTTSPELPATTLADSCYYGIFWGCTSLITPPELPATELESDCYRAMFWDCTSLITPPKLPATTLADSCYYGMFNGCTSLTIPPELPAKILWDSCYYNMFKGCSSLEYTTQLPISYIGNYSCAFMFSDCKKISISDTPSATNKYAFRIPCLGSVSQGYNTKDGTYRMFSGLTPNLNKTYYVNKRPVGMIILEPPKISISNDILTITLPFDTEYIKGFKIYNGRSLISTQLFDVTTLDLSTALMPNGNYVISVKCYGDDIDDSASSEQLIYKYGNFTPIESGNYIAFEAEDNLTFTLKHKRNQAYPRYWDGTVEYSTNGIVWNTWDGNEINSSEYGKLYLRGTNNTKMGGRLGVSDSNFVLGGNSVRIQCNGNIENLLDYQTVASGQHPTMGNYCFYYLFAFCSDLVKAPDLPATTLTEECYHTMFSNCSKLQVAPSLPATTLANRCYSYMFRYCTSLTTLSELPATTLTKECYYYMFQSCTSLTATPELPATTLADGCYCFMFLNCTSLTTTPELPATTLTALCYNGMFQECTSLTTLPKLPATTLIDRCYQYMFYKCKSLKISSTQTSEYQYAWRIPTSEEGTTATNWNFYMLSDTGGTFKSSPEINTTYYTTNEPV